MSTELIQISSGSGPLEVRAFVAKLAERIEHLSQERGLCILDLWHDGPEDAPRSVTLRVEGGASLALASELGTHVLMARSPSRSKASRKRWYASVSTHPEEKTTEPTACLVSEKDLVITACRAGGPGGQNVNKVSSAVRVEHLPSGVVVRAMTQRSQSQNRAAAIERISEILQRRAQEALQKNVSERRQTHHQLIRGNPIKAYRLSPQDELQVVVGRA